jgi:acetolactate synthase-1/2/3 large subunit
MKLSDYVTSFLVDRGIRDIFLLAGGGIMHLLDSVGSQAGLSYYCCRHEQACVVAAEGYARSSGRPGVALVTTGPGAINAISGVVGAWYDSIPLIVLSGQVRRDLIADFAKLRQKGPQEGDVRAMAAPVTKYMTTVTRPEDIRRELEHAFHCAMSGRPGPVWIEIPVDVQALAVDERGLVGFDPPPAPAMLQGGDVQVAAHAVAEELRKAKRPLIVAGAGIRLAHAEPRLAELMEVVPVPVVAPDAGKDLVPEDHPLNIGVFGPAAQRRANFAVQNCDLLVVLAAGLSAKKIGFGYRDFAAHARKIIVDIDRDQLDNQVIGADMTVHCDVGAFLESLTANARLEAIPPKQRWLDACSSWKERYPLVAGEHLVDTGFINSYVFMDTLSEALSADDVLVTGNGLESVSFVQAFKVKPGQRAITNINWGAMGWDLPLAVGASLGSGRRRTICVAGDGTVQMNLQELMTIRHYDLPVKVFVFNNGGYSTIRATQRSLLDGRIVASDPATGVDDPDFAALSQAFHLPFHRLVRSDGLAEGIRAVLAESGPAMCEVMISPEQEITPKASAFRRPDGSLESRPLEDMYPFLPREEVYENMHLFDSDAAEMA